MKKKFVISCLTANSKHFKFEYNLVKTFIKKFPNISLILIVRKKDYYQIIEISNILN